MLLTQPAFIACSTVSQPEGSSLLLPNLAAAGQLKADLPRRQSYYICHGYFPLG